MVWCCYFLGGEWWFCLRCLICGGFGCLFASWVGNFVCELVVMLVYMLVLRVAAVLGLIVVVVKRGSCAVG